MAERHMHPWGPCYADHPEVSRNPSEPRVDPGYADWVARMNPPAVLESSPYPFTDVELNRMAFARFLISKGTLNNG